jgi:hypothetical protein
VQPSGAPPQLGPNNEKEEKGERDENAILARDWRVGPMPMLCDTLN